MEIIHRLLADTVFLLVLLFSAMTGNCLMINATQGMISFRLLSFDVIKGMIENLICFDAVENRITKFDPIGCLLTTAILAIPNSCLTIVSWIGSEAVYFFNTKFDVLEIFFVSGCFFLCAFLFISYCNLGFVYSDSKDGEYYYPFSIGGLNLSFTPAIIITLFITIGMFFTYYHHQKC
jgi:hypothetical protein